MSMSKYSIGQKLFLCKGNSDELVPIEIIGWRGGGVAPYEIKCLDGKSTWRYASARDMIAICDEKACPPVIKKYLTTDEKLDLLLEHLGLRIEIEPQVVEVASDEEKSD